MKRVLNSFVPAVLMFILATALFCLPADQLPKEDWLGDISADKIAHVVLFAALVALWGFPLAARVYASANNGLTTPGASAGVVDARVRRMLLVVVLCAIAYGIVIEFVQEYLVVNRSFSVADMVADAGGSILGYFVVRYVQKRHLTSSK